MQLIFGSALVCANPCYIQLHMSGLIILELGYYVCHLKSSTLDPIWTGNRTLMTHFSAFEHLGLPVADVGVAANERLGFRL